LVCGHFPSFDATQEEEGPLAHWADRCAVCSWEFHASDKVTGQVVAALRSVGFDDQKLKSEHSPQLQQRDHFMVDSNRETHSFKMFF
jgi:tRNA U54 and U55 pseudouridine synthase Pus10